MNGWRKPCEHGRYEAHGGHRPPPSFSFDCPGGVQITNADLEALPRAHRLWACRNGYDEPVDLYRSQPQDQKDVCEKDGCGLVVVVDVGPMLLERGEIPA